jgi:hypothetical protein
MGAGQHSNRGKRGNTGHDDVIAKALSIQVGATWLM